eukprot:4083338-Ditylum_brightwellii.AAC.1
MTANGTMSTSTSCTSTPDDDTQGNKFPKLISALGIPTVTSDQHTNPKNRPKKLLDTKETTNTKIDGGTDTSIKKR